jgi:hypothetical protein
MTTDDRDDVGHDVMPDDWQRQHAERVEQLLARLVEVVGNLVDVVSELVPDTRRTR